jgi:hypothetical protein
MSEMSEAELCQLLREIDPNAPDLDLANLLPPLRWSQYQALSMISGLGFQWAGVNLPSHYMRQYQDNIFVYRFTWDEEPAPFDFLIGAGHALEIPFVFGNFQSDKDSILRFAWTGENRSSRLALSEVMMNSWAEFARTGVIEKNISTDGFQEYAVHISTPWWGNAWVMGLILVALSFLAVKLHLRYLSTIHWPTKLIVLTCALLAVALVAGLSFMTLNVAVFVVACFIAACLSLPNASLLNHFGANVLPVLGINFAVFAAIMLVLGFMLDTRNVHYWGIFLGILAFAVILAARSAIYLLFLRFFRKAQTEA